MITHIVLFKLKKSYSKDEKMFAIEIIKKELERLPFLISEIKDYKVKVNINESERAAELGIISEFENQEDLEKYIIHPAHQKVVEIIKEHREFSVVLDF